MTLDVAIPTYTPEGIRRVAGMNLPAVEGVTYIVSWQDHRECAVPDILALREDVKVWRYDGRGLSRNFNNAFEHCTSDVVLLGNDDVVYTADGLQRVIDSFGNAPDVVVATFRSLHGDPTRFPSESVDLHLPLPKGYSVCSIEIAFRRLARLRCCPELGLGATRLHGGEDEALLFSALHRGLRCRFFSETICAHPGESTGTKAGVTAANLRAFGCVIALGYPSTALLRVPLKAWRLWRSGRVSLLGGLRHITSGALAARGVLKRNHDTLW